MFEVIRDIIVASIIFFIGSLTAEARFFSKGFKFKRVIYLLLTFCLLFITLRIFSQVHNYV